MHIETFETAEEMQAALAANAKAAAEGLHPAQKNLSLGDHWVQFYELDANPPFIIFGRVVTEQECYDQWDAEDDEGPQGEAAARERARLTENHLLYGWAASNPFPEGEWGYTHKASVWPIEAKLFDKAQSVEWNVNRLDADGRFLLELAFRSQRAHVLTQVADTHDPKPVTRDEVAAVLTRIGQETYPENTDDFSLFVGPATDAVMELIDRG